MSEIDMEHQNSSKQETSNNDQPCINTTRQPPLVKEPSRPSHNAPLLAPGQAAAATVAAAYSPPEKETRKGMDCPASTKARKEEEDNTDSLTTNKNSTSSEIITSPKLVTVVKHRAKEDPKMMKRKMASAAAATAAAPSGSLSSSSRPKKANKATTGAKAPAVATATATASKKQGNDDKNKSAVAQSGNDEKKKNKKNDGHLAPPPPSQQGEDQSKKKIKRRATSKNKTILTAMATGIPEADSGDDEAKQVDVTTAAHAKANKNDEASTKEKKTRGEKAPGAETNPKSSSSLSPFISTTTQCSALESYTTTDLVMQATGVVTRTLFQGPWPTVASSSTSPTSSGGSSTMDLHLAHSSGVCAALLQFARDVIVPAMNAEHRGTVLPLQDRTPVILSTLLILREVMTQNAQTIFGEDAILSGLEQDFEYDADKDEKAPDNERDIRENILFSSQLLATSVVFAGLEGTGPASMMLTQKFVAMMESYDSGGEDFALCLSPMEFKSKDNNTALRNGKNMGEEELLAWQVSYK
jgi:hypothetical protein